MSCDRISLKNALCRVLSLVVCLLASRKKAFWPFGLFAFSSAIINIESIQMLFTASKSVYDSEIADFRSPPMLKYSERGSMFQGL